MLPSTQCSYFLLPFERIIMREIAETFLLFFCALTIYIYIYICILICLVKLNNGSVAGVDHPLGVFRIRLV